MLGFFLVFVFSAMDVDGGSGGGNMEGESEMWMDLDWEDPIGDAIRKRTLVGRVVSERSLNRNTMKGMIQKAWNLQKGLGITKVSDSTYRFSFDKEEDYNRVLKRRPWMILGHLLLLDIWKPKLTLEEVELSWSPYWAQFHGLPLEGFFVNNIIKLPGRLGKVLVVEDPFVDGKVVRNFVRAKVLMDVWKPFSAGVFIPRPGLTNIWVSMKYEKLQQLCLRCGILDHEQKSCKKKGETFGSGNNGGWLGAEPLR